MRLTPGELREFSAELDSVLDKWTARFRHTATREAGMESESSTRRDQVFLFLHAFPYSEDEAQGAES
jgi:ABC-type transporter Mla subunit MlaD